MSADVATGRDPGGWRFLDPDVLARIDDLDLLARTVVDGFVAGLHRAVHLGVSTDFAEHRVYAPGDDVRQIDWKVFARTERLYIKTFEAETNTDVVIALDVSASMGFGSHPTTKLDYARYAAACIAHMGSRQRDRVGLATFAADVVDQVPPGAGRREAVLHGLDRARPADAGNLRDALTRLGTGLRRRGIVVLISDFYHDADDVGAALDELRARGQDVIAIQVLDPLERDLDLAGATVLEDLETGERLAVDPAQVRDGHARLVREHVEAIGRACAGRGVDHGCFDTATALDHVLVRFLTERARLARVR